MNIKFKYSQQVFGRGLRLCNGKKDCLLLDFVENIENQDLEKRPEDSKHYKKRHQTAKI